MANEQMRQKLEESHAQIEQYQQEIEELSTQIEAGVDELEQYASEFLFTCVEKDGVMRSTSREGINRMNKSTYLPITAAGGVFYLDEIAILSKLGVNIQLGKALHTGDLILSEAFVASLNWEKGFIPTVVIDEGLQVLMRTYSDQESLLKTFETEDIWFFRYFPSPSISAFPFNIYSRTQMTAVEHLSVI